jgi:hypothetical protein
LEVREERNENGAVDVPVRERERSGERASEKQRTVLLAAVQSMY